MTTKTYQPNDELLVHWERSAQITAPQRGDVAWKFNRGDVTKFPYKSLKVFLDAGYCRVVTPEEAAALTTPGV
jgi:hypothetical protein